MKIKNVVEVACYEGFSKGFAMTGYRLGYLAANQHVIEKVTKLQASAGACVCVSGSHCFFPVQFSRQGRTSNSHLNAYDNRQRRKTAQHCAAGHETIRHTSTLRTTATHKAHSFRSSSFVDFCNFLKPGFVHLAHGAILSLNTLIPCCTVGRGRPDLWCWHPLCFMRVTARCLRCVWRWTVRARVCRLLSESRLWCVL